MRKLLKVIYLLCYIALVVITCILAVKIISGPYNKITIISFGLDIIGLVWLFPLYIFDYYRK